MPQRSRFRWGITSVQDASCYKLNSENRQIFRCALCMFQRRNLGQYIGQRILSNFRVVRNLHAQPVAIRQPDESSYTKLSTSRDRSAEGRGGREGVSKKR